MSKYSRGEGALRVGEAFAFKHELIYPGDVLLCTRPSDTISKLIRGATAGTFSHAAICTKSPIFLEADFSGVCNLSLERFLITSAHNARILRLKCLFDPEARIAASAAGAAAEYETGRYDKIAAVASVFGGAKFGSGLFCSYVVSAAYASAGLNIVRAGKAPAATTPADIELSPHFDDITEIVLKRVALAPDGEYYFLDRPPQYPIGEIDKGDVETPNQLYVSSLQAVGDRASDFLEARGLPRLRQYTDVYGALVQYRDEPWFDEFDRKLSSSIDELAYPILSAAQAQLETAQGRDTKLLLDQIDDEISEEKFRAIVSQERSRIETTQELLRERSQTVDLFKVGQKLFEWKVLSAWLRCEMLIEQCLISNLMMYDERMEYLCVFGEGRERFDPARKVGLTRGNRDEETVWKEFSQDKQRLARVAGAIRQAVSSGLGTRDDAEEEGDVVDAPEGRILTRLHRSRERSRKLVERCKKRALAEHGRLFCEVCSFDFEKSYGSRGKGVIKVHHTKPLETLVEGARTRLEDLALLCANCHRVVHSVRLWLTLDQLRSLID